MQSEGVGEIIINSIDRDGTMNGFHLDILEKHKHQIKVPSTIIGGAKSYSNIKNLFDNYKLVGAGCGSLFIYKGVHKGILINYPSLKDKQNLIYD